MARRLFFILSLSLTFAGCRVGPDYHPPATSLDKSFGPAPAPVFAQSSVLNSSASETAAWWATLKDPILNSLIEQAVKANHDLRLAAARVREARAMRAVAGAAQYPSVDINASESRNRFSKTAAPYSAFDVPGFPWGFDLYQAGFDASWELDVFGAVRRSVEEANAGLEASVEGQRAVLVSVLAEVARNYVELRGYQQRFEISSRDLETQRETLELATDRNRKGTATRLDVSRAAAQVSTTEAGLPLLTKLKWQAMHRLAVLVGQQPGALVETLSATQPVPLPPAEVPIGVPAELLRRRPDIRRAERELAAATARVGMATADLYPRFSLTGSFSMQSSEFSDLPKWISRSFEFGPTLLWPIFEGGRLRAVVEVRSAEQEQALVSYEQTVLRSLEEVHDAIAAFVTEQDRRKSLQEAVRANQESTDLARELYRKGLTDFTTVLDSEEQLHQTQEALLENEATVTTSLIALYKALGGGWEMTLRPRAAERGPAGK
jgi:NodT family efflux transporter outer membrane factor (OMF) lipoprotein